MTQVFFRKGGPSLEVGKILCIGRNYSEHATEMKAEVPNEPVVFLKPSTALLQSGGTVVVPPFSHDAQHELEMVVVMGKEGKNIPRSSAYDFVAGYAVGLDLTLRDVQSEAKKKGLPWTVAKGFDTSAPISLVVDRKDISDPHNLTLSLKVNTILRQQGNTGAMIFAVDTLIAYLSGIFSLERGDLIFTGTPEGVGPIASGDILEAELGSYAKLRVSVA